MIRLVIYTAISLLSIQVLNAQEFFQRSYGGEGSDYGRAVIECSTGGYLLVGSTNSYYDASTDMYILRVDEAGDYIWGRNIGVPNKIDWARDVKENSEGNFVIAGYTNATLTGDYDGTLTEIDPSGNILWSKNYGEADWDFLENMVIDESGSIYLAGQTTLSGELVGWLIKTTETGEIIWEKHFPGNGISQLTGVDICADGQIVFTGYNYSVMTDLNTQISGVITPEGETDWVASYPEFGNVTTLNCICSQSNHLSSAGTTHLDSTQSFYYSGINIENGEIVWTQSGGPEYQRIGSGINQLENGYMLFAVSIYGLGYADLDDFVEIRNQNGYWFTESNSQVFGGIGYDYFHGVIPTSDGGYAAIGETTSFGNNSQIHFVKATAAYEIDHINQDFLDITTSDENTELENPFQLWPNPAIETVHLSGISLNSGLITYQITDLQGKIINTEVLSQKNGNASIDVANIPSGMYLLQILTEKGNTYTYKFVKSL